MEAQVRKLQGLGAPAINATTTGKPAADVGGDYTQGGPDDEARLTDFFQRHPKAQDAYGVGGCKAFIANCLAGDDRPDNYV